MTLHLALLLVTTAHATEEDFGESGVGIHGVDLWVNLARPHGALNDLTNDARPGGGLSLGVDLRLSPHTHSTRLLLTAGIHALTYSRPSAEDDGPARIVSGLWTVARLGVKTRHTIAAPAAGRTILIASAGIAQPRLGQTTTYREGDRKGQAVTESELGTPGPFFEIGLAWDTPKEEHKSPRFEPYAIYFTHRTGSNNFDGRLGSWMSFLQLGVAVRFGS
ncbi:MAG: hypothetical protein ABGY41_12985 [Candidatus Poribacteria bacterium]